MTTKRATFAKSTVLVALNCAGALAVLPALAFAAELPTLPQAWPQPAPASCFGGFYDFALASDDECPLSWNGVTLYGRIDVGAGYETHGVPFNGAYPNGVETLVSKNSNGSRTTILPNGLGQSNVGVKGDEPIAPDWSLVFNFQAGFNPYYPQLANGPRSLVENNLAALEFQSANGDSSRAGQLFNTIAYAGISNRTFGEVTVGRHNSLILDGLGRYDAMGAAPAFSVIGASNTVAGAGDTENARYNTSVQYRVSIGPFRLAALYQFGGYDQGNGSNGTFDAQIGGDFGGFSFDAVGSKVKDAVSLSNFGEYPLPSGVGVNDLKARLSNNTAGALLAKYNYNIATIFGGFEYILFQNPSDAYPNGLTTLGDYTVLPGYVTSTAYTNNKNLRVFWTGLRLAIRDDLDVNGAYYHYYQNDYNTGACTDGGLSQGCSVL